MYGLSVATAGDVNRDGYSDVIVGAPLHSGGGGFLRGRAYLYLGAPAGLSTTPAWVASGDEDGSTFGYAVATAGDVNGDGYADVIVSAPNHDAGSIPGADRGMVYVFLGSYQGLATSAGWSVAGDEDGAALGSSIGTAGDVNGDGYSDIVLGAPYHDAGGPVFADRGRAYVYDGSAAGLSSTPSTMKQDPSSEDGAFFGWSVGTAGDVNGDGFSDVVIGAPAHDAGGAVDTSRGQAYVYGGSVYGLYYLLSVLQGDEDGANFGWSVGTAGDVDGDGYADVIVGAYLHDAGGAIGADRGRAYLHRGSPIGVAATAAWTASGDEDGAELGFAVATAGDVNGDGFSDVVVGAPYHDNGNGPGADRGITYVHHGSSAGLDVTAAWWSGGLQDGAWSGSAVATAGDVNGDGFSDVIVGAQGHDGGGAPGSMRGRALTFLGAAGALQDVPAWVGSGDETEALFGQSVASAGDVNGDGFSDVVVGAYLHDAGGGAGANRGRAYLFLGSAAGLLPAPAWTVSGDEDGAFLGYSVAGAGDVNGDGFSDVIVGAYLHDGGGASGANRGRVYLYLGSSTGLAATPAWTATGDEDGCQLGNSVASAGDVNRDGFSDVIVGAFWHDAGNGIFANRGRAYVYHGSISGLGAGPAWTGSGDEDDARYGYSVSGAGDTNGDGYSDVVVSAVLHDGGGSPGADRGRAYVHLGSPAGVGTSPAWVGSGDEDGAAFGCSVAAAGDTNGDGYSDIVVGAYLHDGGGPVGSDRGTAYFFPGTPSGPWSSSTWSISSVEDGAYFGYSVGGGGDVNGDGYSDVLVGVYGKDFAGFNRGGAYLYAGTASGLQYYHSWWISGDEDSAFLGQSVSAAGDVNGDGYADVIVAAPGHDAGGADRGRAYVHLGNDVAGAPILPRQLRSDLSAPISPLGAAYQQAFRLGLTMRSPVGRTKGRIQWQLAKLGESFSPYTNPIQSSYTWWSSTGAGSARTIPMSLPDQPMPYAWRARIVYDPVTSPFLPRGPWVTITSNGLTETDLVSTSQAPPPPCSAPDEAVFIASMTLNGQSMPVLTIQDPNQPTSVTGYNVYRATAPAGPFTLVASDVVDMDAGTPDIQWVDQNGASGGPYYYEANAYNHGCAAEGP